jgi:hypothetical protein
MRRTLKFVFGSCFHVVLLDLRLSNWCASAFCREPLGGWQSAQGLPG